MNSQTAFSDAPAWGQAVSGLRLGLSAQGDVVHLSLQNVGHAPLEVLSYVNAGEMHLDWYKLLFKDAKGHTRTMVLYDERDKSGPVTAHIVPGAAISHAVNITDWATRTVNGGRPLAAGPYRLSAFYDVPVGNDHWNGLLEAGPITLTIPGR